MRILLAAIGRLGRIPEAALARDYAQRATASGRSLGLGPVEILEVEPRKPGNAAEGEALLEAAGQGAFIVACDERGEAFASRRFAEKIATLRDQGERRLVFLIGGADGLSDEVRAAARPSSPSGPRPGPTRWPAPCWPSRSIGR